MLLLLLFHKMIRFSKLFSTASSAALDAVIYVSTVWTVRHELTTIFIYEMKVCHSNGFWGFVRYCCCCCCCVLTYFFGRLFFCLHIFRCMSSSLRLESASHWNATFITTGHPIKNWYCFSDTRQKHTHIFARTTCDDLHYTPYKCVWLVTVISLQTTIKTPTMGRLLN